MISRHHTLAVPIALVLLTMMTMTAKAVNPCLPCTNGSWSALNAHFAVLSNGCVVRIAWQELLNCPGDRRYRIDAVEFVSGACAALSMSQIMAEVAGLMADHDPAGLGPQMPDSCDTITVALGSVCWARTNDPRFVSPVALACQVPSCCARVYEVCLDTARVRTVSFISTTAYGECNLTTDPYGNMCEDACQQ